MFSHILGLIIALGVVVGPIIVMGGNQAIFISIEAIIIVGGGTAAIALIAYPYRHVKHLLRVMFVVVRKEVDDGPMVAREIIEVSMKTRGERTLLQGEVENIRNAFFKDAVELIIERIDEELCDILEERIKLKQEEDERIAGMIRKLGTFPPALGLLATVLALVHLLQSMGSGATGMQNLGPSMAIGLVGTLYGIVASNLFFAPIAENLSIKSAFDVRNRQMVVIGIELLLAKKSPLIVQEAVNSMLRFEQRVDMIGGIEGGRRVSGGKVA